MTRGVPQGSLLGPLYVNDMPSVVRLTVLNMYADDTTVYTAGKCPTQVAQYLTNELQHLSTWCQANHLRINPVKTTAMFLCRGRLQRCGDAKIYLDGHPLENKSVTDYLGVTIDSQLTFRQHVAKFTSKAYGVIENSVPCEGQSSNSHSYSTLQNPGPPTSRILFGNLGPPHCRAHLQSGNSPKQSYEIYSG